MGMKKDFLLSENEKQQRRKYPEENRDNSSKSLSNSESLLPAFDEIDRVSVYVLPLTFQLFRSRETEDKMRTIILETSHLEKNKRILSESLKDY